MANEHTRVYRPTRNTRAIDAEYAPLIAAARLKQSNEHGKNTRVYAPREIHSGYRRSQE
jgi:hypothetical protein